MHTAIIESLAKIPAADWNALVQDQNPFLSHEFLSALERHGCVGERSGWIPRHIVCHDRSGKLVGAAPVYIKLNFYGEFVFDHSWEAAYQRHGLPYYPKLVSAVPFTPATGQRLLLTPGLEEAIARALIERAMTEVERLGCSSLHWLFPCQADLDRLTAQGLLKRLGCQFHWDNPGYRDFADFLDTLSSKKRKNIKRERRSVYETGLSLEVITGSIATAAQWRTFHRFYCSTFQRRWGFPVFTQAFFEEIGKTLGERIVLVLAQDGKRDVAGAICYRSDTTLYGRHWGCFADYNNLHFETCYYQGIEYCIREGLHRFEPGAQGEHKISRGFLPTLTYSAHWLAHPAFNRAIADFLERETPAMQEYARDLSRHSPYRTEIS